MFDNWLEFDDLLKLAQDNPEHLENWRKSQVDSLISSAPEEFQRRLRGLQFQIDCERQKHSSPMGTCVAISRMMYESMDKLNQALLGEKAEPRPTQAAVVPFPVSV
ncbi:DUF3135 domain-containing protein [Saccharophagus degradans]|uniref:DUF3135 domain-containing protein n=1 Tax=Saccharophagus degradans TaxID=86304 RepID=UPI001C085BA3|nr:DUF3135 domain-containing protein [Saccharophagus degradans]MBU2984329.1 DUF3135 domain-containing protein [Saccharophagus degradans]